MLQNDKKLMYFCVLLYKISMVDLALQSKTKVYAYFRNFW